MKSLSVSLAITGAFFLASTIVLAITQAPLGSPVFFACAAGAGIAYMAMLRRVWHEPRASPRLLTSAFLLALAFRAPLVVPPVGPDSDMERYLWDGRLQILGYNPYAMVPADPALAALHTDETRAMPSIRTRTPYPPAAQLFFRLVVSIHDSTLAMKVALVLCDLLTMIVLWRWLVFTGRSEWLALAYAWNPLVVLEVAHSGHIDALGALWITASAYWLARRRTALASIAFVLAVATKLLPHRARAAVLEAGAVAGRGRRFSAAGGAVCGLHDQRHLAARRRAERGGAHPVQRAAVQDDHARRQPASRSARRGGTRNGRRDVGALEARRRRRRRVGMADGGRARLRAGDLPVVFALPHTVSVHRRNAATHRLDLHRALHLCRLAHRTPGRPLGGAHRPDVDRVRRPRGSRGFSGCPIAKQSERDGPG